MRRERRAPGDPLTLRRRGVSCPDRLRPRSRWSDPCRPARHPTRRRAGRLRRHVPRAGRGVAKVLTPPPRGGVAMRPAALSFPSRRPAGAARRRRSPPCAGKSHLPRGPGPAPQLARVARRCSPRRRGRRTRSLCLRSRPSPRGRCSPQHGARDNVPSVPRCARSHARAHRGSRLRRAARARGDRPDRRPRQRPPRPHLRCTSRSDRPALGSGRRWHPMPYACSRAARRD